MGKISRYPFWHFDVRVSDRVFTESADGRLQFIETQGSIAIADAVQAKVALLRSIRNRHRDAG